MSMMHLAALVTLGGTPMLASGVLLWRKVKAKGIGNLPEWSGRGI